MARNSKAPPPAERDLRAEHVLIDAEIAGLHAQIRRLLLAVADADTSECRTALKTHEARAAEIARLLADIAAKFDAAAEAKADRETTDFVAYVIAGIKAKLDALQPPGHP
ncbi:MAG: hypothetical protein ACLQJR_05740 [Stellaceae bacterium]